VGRGARGGLSSERESSSKRECEESSADIHGETSL